MRRIKNLVIGGIQSKVFNLILYTVMLLTAAFMAISIYQNNMLTQLAMESSQAQSRTLYPPFRTAMSLKSSAEILAKTNEAICSNNEAQMFVTVWLGILEISTGKLTCANAGHEYPVFKSPDGNYALYKDRHGFVIGGMENVKYREYEIQLEPGAKLFVYTDGVREATNTEKELFGTDRMMAALNAQPDAAPQEVLKNVCAYVDDFVKEAEQFDDLTMLCMEYTGNTKEKENPADGE